MSQYRWHLIFAAILATWTVTPPAAHSQQGSLSGAGRDVKIERELTLPATSASRPAVTLDIRVEPTGADARVVVRDGRGELIGSVAPFALPAQGTQPYRLILPREIEDAARRAQGRLKVTIEVELLDAGAKGPARLTVDGVAIR